MNALPPRSPTACPPSPWPPGPPSGRRIPAGAAGTANRGAISVREALGQAHPELKDSVLRFVDCIAVLVNPSALPTTAGRSTRIPLVSGHAFRMADSSAPWSPPTSTIVENPVKSQAAATAPASCRAMLVRCWLKTAAALGEESLRGARNTLPVGRARAELPPCSASRHRPEDRWRCREAPAPVVTTTETFLRPRAVP
jgi:hypothetical protein